MDLYGFTWIYMNWYECIWMYLKLHGFFLWIYMNLQNWFLWKSEVMFSRELGWPLESIGIHSSLRQVKFADLLDRRPPLGRSATENWRRYCWGLLGTAGDCCGLLGLWSALPSVPKKMSNESRFGAVSSILLILIQHFWKCHHLAQPCCRFIADS